MTKFIIRAALHDEANEGWIWTEGFQSRSLVEISNRDNGRSVICQTRKLDNNFLKVYNAENACRRKIKLNQDTIVISSWYRDALGGFDTTDEDDVTGRVVLDVCQRRSLRPWWQMRAASHHPDIVVRLGVRLGGIGIWLGLLSIWLGLLSVVAPGGCAKLITGVSGPVVLLLTGALLIAACWPPRTSPVSSHA
ncbi:hypothetical protein [Rhizobium leguminosarum]|uniref:hypothetical protein n=1 Tax=Rhizobium leguminosarum TaxID=384 RepID=UPI0014420596|nr:hypothetical protein [Rhizobium leguminosarum]MBY5868638.1 hypothetical protein [Rhizobium leguminosarum]NKL80985.1 hypothetical protein [Rhizobium leguminosarum bv. viciae]NKM08010.1 hypothetical protein [Rhizobium leguminosarum bv. viciae]